MGEGNANDPIPLDRWGSWIHPELMRKVVSSNTPGKSFHVVPTSPCIRLIQTTASFRKGYRKEAVRYSWFLIKGSWSVHSFNGSWGNGFQDIPDRRSKIWIQYINLKYNILKDKISGHIVQKYMTIFDNNYFFVQ